MNSEPRSTPHNTDEIPIIEETNPPPQQSTPRKSYFVFDMHINLRYILWFILMGLGWHKLADGELNRVKEPKKAVYIFPHTSHWDFWLTAMHSIAYTGLTDHIYTVIKPQAFKLWYGKYLRLMNCIPATKAEDSGGSFVDSNGVVLNPTGIAVGTVILADSGIIAGKDSANDGGIVSEIVLKHNTTYALELTPSASAKITEL